jgi:hypothetical protein
MRISKRAISERWADVGKTENTRIEVMTTQDRRDEVATESLDYFNGLSLKERSELTDALRDPRTYFAGNFEDLLAVLKHIESDRA